VIPATIRLVEFDLPVIGSKKSDELAGNIIKSITKDKYFSLM
jgi:hypothetical protein